MNRNTKTIEVAGNKYTLTANRKLISTMADFCPDLLDLDVDTDSTKFERKMSLKFIGGMDIVFYEMIRTAHPEISKQKSDDILDSLEDEYEDVPVNLLKFAMSVFTAGNPSQSKKKLNW